MNRWLLFSLTTGAGVQVVGCPEADAQALADAQDLGLIELATGSDTTHYVDLATGALAAIPARPGPHHVFDWTSKTWQDPRTLQDLKAAKWQEIKRARSAAEFSPFDWDGSSFDANASAIQHISGAVQMALLSQLAGQPFAIDWTLADNTVRTLSGADMIAVGIAAGAHSGAVYGRARALRGQIAGATTPQEVAAIAWPAP